MRKKKEIKRKDSKLSVVESLETMEEQVVSVDTDKGNFTGVGVSTLQVNYLHS